MRIDIEEALDAMPGITYVTDRAGTIVAIGRQNWNAFACANGGERLIDGAGVIGRSLFDFIAGDAVREGYRRCHGALLGEGLDFVRLLSRCDSPGVRRNLWIMMTPLRPVDGVLVQVLIVSETLRPPVGLFDVVSLRTYDTHEAVWPMLTMCSHCQNVRFPAGSAEEEGTWMSCEAYYQHGGSADVRVSHGMCPTCFEQMEAMFPPPDLAA